MTSSINEIKPGFKLVKQNWFAKKSEHSEEKCCYRWKMFAENVEKFANHFMENAKSLIKFWELIWVNMYHESLIINRRYSKGLK